MEKYMENLSKKELKDFIYYNYNNLYSKTKEFYKSFLEEPNITKYLKAYIKFKRSYTVEGIYRYKHINDFKKFDETKLPKSLL